jgi:hypothetical protein
MARSKVLTGVVIGAAALAGALVWRRRSRRHDHVDLYYADGSMVSLEQGSPDADTLLPLAHDVVAAARTSI